MSFPVNVWINNSDAAIHVYEMEQLSKWMVNDVAQFLTVKVGVYGQAKGRDQNDQCGNRLDTETSVRTQL